MQLANTGREYLVFEVADAADGTIAVTFDAGAIWYVTDWVSGTEVRVLVAGPGAVSNPPGTVVLGEGLHGIFLRLNTGTEQVIRAAGHIQVEPAS